MVAWQKAIALDEQWQAARYDLGILYLKRGRYYEAAEAFEAVYKSQPDDMETAYFLAVAYKETGRLDETISLLEKVLKTRPEHYMARFHLGATYLRVGNATDGLTHIREYERLKGIQVRRRGTTGNLQLPDNMKSEPKTDQPAQPLADFARKRGTNALNGEVFDENGDAKELNLMQKLRARAAARS
jgi:tetratricopeptide (TPR) repeat protein